MKQKYTSAKTARRQVPALHRLLVKSGLLHQGTTNLDLGGGPYEDATNFLASNGVANLVLDPHNRSLEHNDRVERICTELGGADSCTLANVLNVIAEEEIRLLVLQAASNLVKPGAPVFISVYEGDKSNLPTKTRDGWQLRRRLADYKPEIEAVGLKLIHIRNGCMMCSK